MSEAWAPIAGYEDCYAVSDQGRVKRTGKFGSISKGLLAPRPKRGYITFHLCKNGIRRNPLAHRLVWEAFNGPIPAGMQINHLNGIKTDNRLCNLEICTPSQNLRHSFRILNRPAPNNPSFGSRNGSWKEHIEADIPEIIRLYQTGLYRQADIGQMFGISQRLVSYITRGEQWRSAPPAAS